MFENDKELQNGITALFFGVLVLIAQIPALALMIFACIAAYFGISGLYVFLSEKRSAGLNSHAPRRQRPASIPQTSSAPITDEPTIAETIKSIHIANDFKCPSCGATVLPTYVKCKHCGSVLVDMANLPKPEKWGDVDISQSVHIKHPQKGSMNLSVLHHIYYGELWQVQMKPNVPWTLTGSYYVGLGLSGDIFLINWQNYFYLLDFHQPLNDMGINRDFAPHARKFAASNQTANVSFSYQGTVWHMDDIGRFRVEFAEGDGIKVGPGAVGRFIHASHGNKVLVVEDYQTGGSGLDRLWMGYRMEEEDIKL